MATEPTSEPCGAKVEPLDGERDALVAELTRAIADQTTTIAELKKKVEALEALVLRQAEQLGRNSGNSNLPPSSDRPGQAGTKTRKKSKRGRHRGAQKGHKGSHRVLVSPEEVDEVVDMYPARCEGCAVWLPKTPDTQPTRHQHVELAPFAPHVTEYRRHEVRCEACGHRTRALYDADTPGVRIVAASPEPSSLGREADEP